MADPFQILAQQASQTANLFQAIDKNTQQMFQNKFAVQQAQSSLALNTIQQMEQSKFNDARIRSYEQEMRQRQMQMDAFEKEKAVDDRLAPLREQYDRTRLESGIQANTAARIAPQFDDLKPEIAQTIFESPELADDIQSKYAETITRLTQDALNPNVDIVSRVNESKQELKSFINKKKSQKVLQKGFSESPIGRAASWLTNKLSGDPEPVDIGRSASAYAAFGGDPKEFARRHDPRVKEQLASAVRIAELTGTIEPAVLAELPAEDQDRVLKSIENKKTQRILIDQSKMIQEQVDSLRMLKDKDPENGARYDEAIKSKMSEQDRIMSAFSRIAGISEEQPRIEGPQNPVNQDLQAVLGSMNAGLQDTKEARWNSAQQKKFDNKIKGILRKILPSDEKITDQISVNLLSGNAQLSEELIANAISGINPESIDTLLRQDWFMSHLEEEGMLDRFYEDAQGQRVKLPSEMAKKIEIIRDTEAFPVDRRNAINYLKSRLPKILLDYANQ